jgi:hypothetical protein
MKCSATAADRLYTFFEKALVRPREPPHRHSHREVLPLYVARVDVARVGVACPLLDLHARANARAVPRLGVLNVAGVAVELL